MKHAARAIVCVLGAALAATMGTATAQAAPAQYRIEVQTCNVEDAGTDARVETRLHGTTASTSWINLDNPGDDRKRGRTDTYDRTLADLGPIRSVDIYFDNRGDSPHWCIEEVVIRGPHGVTIHPFHNWLVRANSKISPLRLSAA